MRRLKGKRKGRIDPVACLDAVFGAVCWCCVTQCLLVSGNHSSRVTWASRYHFHPFKPSQEESSSGCRLDRAENLPLGFLFEGCFSSRRDLGNRKTEPRPHPWHWSCSKWVLEGKGKRSTCAPELQLNPQAGEKVLMQRWETVASQLQPLPGTEPHFTA